jgi:hypothetical protein
MGMIGALWVPPKMLRNLKMARQLRWLWKGIQRIKTLRSRSLERWAGIQTFCHLRQRFRQLVRRFTCAWGYILIYHLIGKGIVEARGAVEALQGLVRSFCSLEINRARETMPLSEPTLILGTAHRTQVAPLSHKLLDPEHELFLVLPAATSVHSRMDIRWLLLNLQEIVMKAGKKFPPMTWHLQTRIQCQGGLPLSSNPSVKDRFMSAMAILLNEAVLSVQIYAHSLCFSLREQLQDILTPDIIQGITIQ